MSPRTKQNLLNAMKSEASESATFSRFAAHARMDNDSDLAETLQDSADGDRIKDFSREAAPAACRPGDVQQGFVEATRNPNPDETLFVVCSKTFATLETMTN